MVSARNKQFIYIRCYFFILFLNLVNTFIPSRNLDEVFTYNHKALMSLRSRSHVKASMVLTRADKLCIHNYIRSLLNNILRPILKARTLPHPTVCVSDLSNIYIYTNNFIILIITWESFIISTPLVAQ